MSVNYRSICFITLGTGGNLGTAYVLNFNLVKNQNMATYVESLE
jgi:hypothetical protein